MSYFADNDNTRYAMTLGGLWAVNDMPTLFYNDEPGVWMPKPSIDAFSPPAIFHWDDMEREYEDISLEHATKGATTPTSIHHACTQVPKTIDIPSSPSEAVIVTDNEVSEDVVDDCSSVGMGTVGVGRAGLKRHYEETDDSDDGSSLESGYGGDDSVRKYDKRQYSLFDIVNKDGTTREATSIASVPKGLEWNGSLSYLDGHSEQGAPCKSTCSSPSRGSTSANDNVPIGSFGPAKAVHDQPTQTKHVSHNLDDDSTSSASSDDDDCETVVLLAGSSIPQHSQEGKAFGNPLPESSDEAPKAPSHQWDGSFTFLDCFAKNASLDDFLNAELTATKSAWVATPAPTGDLNMNKTLASLVFHETMVVPWETFAPSPFVVQ